MAHYARIGRDREDQKILDLEKRSLSDKDARATAEFNELLQARVEQRGDVLTPKTLRAELDRIRTRQER